MLSLHPAKTDNAEKLIFSELLRCIVDRINHIYMYFVHTNAIWAIARVGVWCLHPAEKNNAEKLIFAELLRCTLDCINDIYMYFLHANAIETIVRVGVLSVASKNGYC